MVDCNKCGATKIFTKEKTYFCPDCNQLNKTRELEFVKAVGSFDITKSRYETGIVYRVTYQSQHSLAMYWTFKNDLETAEQFALQKTKIDKKLFR